MSFISEFLKKNKGNLALGLLTIVLGIATFLIIQPFIMIFFLALVFVLLFEPLFKLIEKKAKNTYFASALTTLLITLLIVIPVVLVIITATVQAAQFITQLQNTFLTNENALSKLFRDYLSLIPDNLALVRSTIILNEDIIIDLALSSIKNISVVVSNNLFPLIGGGIQMVINIIIFLVTLVYLFPAKSTFFNELSLLNPMDTKKHAKFVARFEAVTKATMKSLIIIATVQGFLGWILYLFLGLPFSTLLGVLQFFVSFLPLGSGMIWIPLGIGLLVTGYWIQGLVVMAWGMFVISTVDNIIRPIILKEGESKLPAIVTLFSALGGISFFGFWGFLFGPIIASLFLTALDMYKEQYTQR